MIKRMVSALCAATILAVSQASAMPGFQHQSHHKEFSYALELLDRGMFNRAGKIFDGLSREGMKSDAEGYSVFCEVKMRANGYETRMLKFMEKHPYSVMVPAIRYQYAMNLFDARDFEEAARQFALISEKQIRKDGKPAWLFYRSYSQLESGQLEAAVEGFKTIDRLKESDFSAAARYILGYLEYERSHFQEALKWFGDAADDSRFQEMSLYYIIECRFLLGDYDFVIDKGPQIFDRAAESKKMQLSRFISEAYLVKGQPEKAKVYFDYNRGDQSGKKNRTDWFYAGSLLYQLEDFEGAADCFSKMEDRSDSLGQVANYHLGYSYIRLKNKVAALDAFKAAAQPDFNKDMKEDAYFNYAKLAFDLNSDTSVFYDYLRKYTNKKKGDRIYSYIAVAALLEKDYQSAIEAYDKIDEFDDDMRDNYVKSNFLRASQLIDKHSYRNAIACLEVIPFYAEHNSSIDKYSKYWLAESCFRTGEYDKAIAQYMKLYNLSAFFGKPEYDNILYGIAYSHFMKEDYAAAAKWFDEYLNQKADRLLYRKDALVRKGDCLYITGNYRKAAELYDQAVADYFNVNDIYPYYQSAISHGLAGDKAKKIALLENVLEAQSTANFYPDAMFELGRSYVAAKEDRKAFDCFKMLSEKSGNANYKARAYLEMGMLARNNNRMDEAIAYYKFIIEDIAETDYSEDALLALEALYKSLQQPEIYLDYIASIGKGGLKTDQEKEQMLFNAAEHIYAGGNHEKALVSLQNFIRTYPNSAERCKAEYYLAESYRQLGQLEKAADYYAEVMKDGQGSLLELSILQYAEISYTLEKFNDAYTAYARLSEEAALHGNKSVGRLGMMRSAFNAHDAEKTISAAEAVILHEKDHPELVREARYCEARSYMSMSERDEALGIYRKLAERPVDRFGAEANFVLIQDAYDQGDFKSVEDRVYAFSASGTSEMYWLAKSFIILGDSFVERGNLKQAKATYESLAAEYAGDGENDDILENVRMRLDKLATMMNVENNGNE